MSEYAIVLLLVFLPTFLLSFHPQSNVKGRIRSICIAIILTAIPFIMWDIWAYNRGHWDFNYDFIWDFALAGLPFEEIAFFFLVPYSSLYVWLVIRDFTTWSEFKKRITNKN